MAAIKMEYCATDGNHVTLNHDGTIELAFNREMVTLNYRQSSMLKAMVLAEDALQKQASR